MQRVWVVGLVLLGTGVRAAANDAVQPVELLQRAASTAAQLNALSFDAEYLADGVLAQSVATLYGSVKVRRDDKGSTLVRIDGQVLMPRAAAASDFRYACDGEKAHYVDDLRRSVAVGPPAEGLSRERDLLLPNVFVSPNPFEQERNAASVTYDGRKKSDGVDCHVLLVKYDPAGRNVAQFYLGVDDLLVRRIERPRNPDTPMASSEIFIARNLKPGDTHADATFALTPPPGYAVRTVGGPPPGSLTIGSPAPDWELPTATGEKVNLKSLRGKVVVLDFWASWCGPCRIAMPHMQKLHERFKNDPVVVYGVNCRERAGGIEKALAFVKEKGFTYPQLIDANGQVANAFRVGGIPRFYVIDPDGKILHTSAGAGPQLEQVLSQVIESAVKKVAKSS